MGIKYHQYGCGNDYGDDHYLTDNWNPDYDYGSQYVEVYFNINTPSYMHAKDSSAFGFASDETRDEWYAAASKVIASFDILEDSGYNVENSAEKRAFLLSFRIEAAKRSSRIFSKPSQMICKLC